MHREKAQDRASGVGRVLCVGGAVSDGVFVAAEPLRRGTSNPAAGARSFGGVARNVAATLARLGAEVSLLSVVGEDAEGEALLADLRRLGIRTAAMRRDPRARTAAYLAVLEPDRSLAFGIADMAILDALPGALSPEDLDPAPDLVFADCNCPPSLLADLLRRAAEPGAPLLAVDAVSTPKVRRLPARLEGLGLLFLNRDEAAACLGRDAGGLVPEAAAAALRERGVPSVVLTLGAEGIVVAAAGKTPRRIAAPAVPVVDVTGAGDALIAGTLAAVLRRMPLAAAAVHGVAAAALALRHAGSAVPDLDWHRLAAAADPLLEGARP